MRHSAKQRNIMSESIDQPRRPNCPALLICQQARTTPQRLVDLLGVMNAIGITQLPADVTFTVHFSPTEEERALPPGAIPGTTRRRCHGWRSLPIVERGGDAETLRVVHEQPVPVTARFSAPGQCRSALYANGERVGHRPLSILQVR